MCNIAWTDVVVVVTGIYMNTHTSLIGTLLCRTHRSLRNSRNRCVATISIGPRLQRNVRITSETKLSLGWLVLRAYKNVHGHLGSGLCIPVLLVYPVCESVPNVASKSLTG